MIHRGRYTKADYQAAEEAAEILERSEQMEEGQDYYQQGVVYEDEEDGYDDDDVEVGVRLDRLAGVPPLGTEERFKIDRQEKREYERMLEEKRKQQANYSFKPQILDCAQDDRPSLVQRAASDQQRLLERAQKRELHEQAYMEKNCPFQPKILAQSEEKANEMFRSGRQGPVEERLLDYGTTRKRNAEELRKLREREERAQLKASFVPKTNKRILDSNPESSSTGSRGGTFLERMEKNLEHVQRRRQELQYNQETVCTFKPKVNPLSEEIYRSREGLNPHSASRDRFADDDDASFQRQQSGGKTRAEVVSERLHAEGKEQKAQRLAMKRQLEADEMNEVSPHPTTNPHSSMIVSHDDAFKHLSFVERQQFMKENHDAAMDELKRKVDQEMRQRVGGGGEFKRVDHEFIQDQVERLYDYSKDVSSEAKNELKVKLQQEQCPFRPQLSVGSEALCRTKQYANVSVHNRLHQYASQRQQRASSVNSRANSVASSSTPGINNRGQKSSFDRPSERRGGSRGNSGLNESALSVGTNDTRTTAVNARDFYLRQIQRQEQRDIKVEQNRVVESMRQEQDCSFRPAVNAGAPRSVRRSRSASSVGSATGGRGEEEFLKRQQAARAKKEEEQARRENLGRGVACNGPNYTVVTPFQLSSATNINTSKIAQKKAAAINNNRPAATARSGGKQPLKSQYYRDQSSSSSRQHMDPLAQLPQNVADTVTKIFSGSKVTPAY